MLNDNSLGDRLNAVKNGKPIPVPPMQPQSVHDINPQQFVPAPQSRVSLKQFLITKSLTMVDILLASFLYGFAVKTIFGFDWSILGAFSVGFLINHAVTIWPTLIRNWFKK